MSNLHGKHRLQRSVDVQPAIVGGGISGGDGGGIDTAPPAGIVPPAPGAPTLTTGLSIRDRSATAWIDVRWESPLGLDATGYYVQYAPDAAFIADSGIVPAARALLGSTPSARLEGMRPDTEYWVRVQTVYREAVSDWSAANSIRTAVDNTPPGPISNLVASWSNAGDLRVSWVNPTDATYELAEITLRQTNANGALILTEYVAGGTSYLFLASENRRLTGGQPVIWVQIRTVAYSGAINTLQPVTLTATKPRPGNVPSATQNWSSDDGTASATWRISWPAVATASRYALTIDGVTRRTTDTLYVMTEEDNRAIHAGVLDPTISYSLVAEDDLGQTSVTPLTGVATNVAPPAPTITVNPTSFNLVVTVTSARPADLAYATVEVLRNGSVLVSGQTTDTRSVWQLGAAGSYSVRVSLTDVFGQTSAATTSVAISLEPLSVESLREGIEYEDDEGTDITILRRLKDDTTATGVSYSA